MILRTVWVATLLACSLPAQDGNVKAPKVFGGATLQEVYRVRLDRDDLLLESLLDVIKNFDIRDGAVLTAVGSLRECTFHGVNSTMTTVKDPMELSNLGGIIADGQPHLHVLLTSKAKGAFGGHLEDGCSVLSHAEVTIVKFSGVPLARKQTGNEGTVLQKR